MNKEWIDADEQALLLMRRDGCSYSIIGAVLGRSVEACKQKYNKTLWKTRPWYSKLDSVRDAINDDKKQATREKLILAHELKSKNRKVAHDILADSLTQNIRALPTVKPPTYAKKRSKQKHESEEVGLMLSDLHIGHNHTLEDTGGLSEYNKNIFLQRVEKMKLAVADIIELHSYLYDLPHLHIFCLGDIVAGMNEVGNWSNVFIDTDIMGQFTEGTKALADMIYYWLPMFKEISFYGVLGNHGRVSRKGVEKDTANWDIVAYKMLELLFADNNRVSFSVPNTWWIKTIIKEHRFLLVHGDDIKGGSVRGLQMFADKWASIANFIPNYTLAGHFHCAAETTTAQGKVLINGSFLGPDIYSLKTLHAGTKPEQKIFGIHSKRGITWTYDIDLREEKVKES